MAKRDIAYYSVVALPSYPANALGGILDMLRYDSANVLEVHAEYFVIKTPRPVTFDRWTSFGLWVTHSFEAIPERAHDSIGVAKSSYDERMSHAREREQRAAMEAEAEAERARKIQEHMVTIVQEIAEAD